MPCYERSSVATPFLASHLLFAVGCLQAMTSVGAEPEERATWHQRCLVGMEVGPTGAQFGHSDPTDSRYCSHWNGAEIVRQCVAANAEYLVLWLRDGDFAYYNSGLLPKAPGLRGRDPLHEAMTEAAQHDLPFTRLQCDSSINSHAKPTVCDTGVDRGSACFPREPGDAGIGP